MFGDRRLVFATGLVVLLGTLAWRYLGAADGPAQPPVARPRPEAQPGAGRTPEAADAAADVRLAMLLQARDEPVESRRNPFRFGRRASEPARPAEAARVFTPVPPAPVEPAGPPPLPPIPLKFIGVVEKEGGAKWAVLSLGEGHAPLHGREGDIIDGRYRILRIGVESIEMAHLDGRGRQTIRLTGQ